MKNVLLYFGANPEKKDNVCKILEDLHLTPIVVSDEENSQQVGYLMKLADFTKQSEKGERFCFHRLFLLHRPIIDMSIVIKRI